LSAADDAAAIDEVLAGNVSAFEAVVRRWERPLVNLAYRFFGDRGKAEEMAQEAFLRAYRSLSTWRRESSFSTWLFALATNLYRSEKGRTPREFVPLLEEKMTSVEQGQELAYEEREKRLAVQRAVESLPARYRDALILFYFNELDIAATAACLALPAGTVKARLARGRELLAKKLRASGLFAPKDDSKGEFTWN
jgi:RNA polymerase sigma-70 factor (ECF subfamily)